MRRFIPLLALSLVLMGQDDCEPTPSEPVNAFCHGTPLKEPSPLDTVARNLREGVRHISHGHVGKGLTAIVGGEVAPDKLSTVWVGAIGYGGCSGGIIDEHTVLTAGHCNAGTTDGRYVVCEHAEDWYEYVKPSEIDGGPYTFDETGYVEAPRGRCWESTSARATIHPGFWRWNYDRSMPHDDIMVLRFPDVTLPKPLGLDHYFPLGYDPETEAEFCQEVRAVGWGAWNREHAGAIPPEGFAYHTCPDEDGDGDTDYRCLLQAEYRIVGKRLWGTAGYIDPDPSQFFVEQVPWGGKCFGDSGSVLYVRVKTDDYETWKIAAVTSTVTDKSCVNGGTDVRVDFYLPWLRSL